MGPAPVLTSVTTAALMMRRRQWFLVADAVEGLHVESDEGRMPERLAVPTRHCHERAARLLALPDEVNQEVIAAVDLGPRTRPCCPA